MKNKVLNHKYYLKQFHIRKREKKVTYTISVKNIYRYINYISFSHLHKSLFCTVGVVHILYELISHYNIKNANDF